MALHLTVSEASQPHHERTAGVTLLQHAAETDTCPAAGALRWEVKTGLQSILFIRIQGLVSAGALMRFYQSKEITVYPLVSFTFKL